MSVPVRPARSLDRRQLSKGPSPPSPLASRPVIQSTEDEGRGAGGDTVDHTMGSSNRSCLT